MIDDDEDDIRFYPLNVADIKRVQTLGNKTRVHIGEDKTHIV